MSYKAAVIIVFTLLSGHAFAADAPSVAGVANAADYSSNLAPGVLAEVFGANFGTGPASSVTVTVGGTSAYVAAVTASQLAVQIPVEVSAGATNMVVTVGGVNSAPFNLTLNAYAPALFTLSGTGSGPGLIRTNAGANVTATLPAQPGDMLVAFAVGLGPTTPATPTGTAPSTANQTASTVTMTVGGLPAKIAYAGVAPGNVGLYQINFTVPARLQGTQPVVISVLARSSAFSPMGSERPIRKLDFHRPPSREFRSPSTERQHRSSISPRV
jgi:uncharacterized protein (TIGR03437 family)